LNVTPATDLAVGGKGVLMSCHPAGGIRPSCCGGLRSPKRSRTRRACRSSYGERTDNAPKVRFSARLGEEPEVEVALV
jgi:hypothetical protein